MECPGQGTTAVRAEMLIEKSCCFLNYFRCNLTLSSWALDNTRLSVDFDGPENFQFTTFFEDNEWLLVTSSASKRIMVYHAGEKEFGEFTQLIYSLTIRRRVGFYVYALIIPSVLLSLLMPLTFWIPPSGDGRITLGIFYLRYYTIKELNVFFDRFVTNLHYFLLN